MFFPNSKSNDCTIYSHLYQYVILTMKSNYPCPKVTVMFQRKWFPNLAWQIKLVKIISNHTLMATYISNLITFSLQLARIDRKIRLVTNIVQYFQLPHCSQENKRWNESANELLSVWLKFFKPLIMIYLQTTLAILYCFFRLNTFPINNFLMSSTNLKELNWFKMELVYILCNLMYQFRISFQGFCYFKLKVIWESFHF